MDYAEKLLSFNTKEEYILWVAEWKRVWKTYSATQRELKKDIRRSHVDRLETVRNAQAEIYWNKTFLRIMLYARSYGKEKIKAMV